MGKVFTHPARSVMETLLNRAVAIGTCVAVALLCLDAAVASLLDHGFGLLGIGFAISYLIVAGTACQSIVRDWWNA